MLRVIRCEPVLNLAEPILRLKPMSVILSRNLSLMNVASMMGMTMIIGIITEVAIFYFSAYQDLLKTLGHRKAWVQAGINRMCPIAMTTIAAILALLPLC